MERAPALDPNDPSSYAFMGYNILNMAGRPKEAVEYLNKGMRLDPHNPGRYRFKGPGDPSGRVRQQIISFVLGILGPVIVRMVQIEFKIKRK